MVPTSQGKQSYMNHLIEFSGQPFEATNTITLISQMRN